MSYRNNQQFRSNSNSYHEFSFKKSPTKFGYFQSHHPNFREQKIIKPLASGNWLNSQGYNRLKKIPEVYQNLRQTINSYSYSSSNDFFADKPYQPIHNDIFRSPEKKVQKDNYLRQTINYSQQQPFNTNTYLSHSAVGFGSGFKKPNTGIAPVSASSHNIDTSYKWKKQAIGSDTDYVDFSISKVQRSQKELPYERKYDKFDRNYKQSAEYQKVSTDDLKNNSKMLNQLKRLQEQRKNRMEGRIINERLNQKDHQPYRKLDTQEIKRKYLKSQYQNRDFHTPKVQTKKIDKVSNYSAKEFDYKSRKSKSPIMNEFKTQKQSYTHVKGFLLLKSLGQGKFGTVYQSMHILTGAIFAIKKVPKSIIKEHLMVDQFLLQVKLQSFFDNPNIVKIYGVFDDKDSIYLILEYMEEGTLFTYLKKNKTIKVQEAAVKIKDVARAVEEMHESGVAHRDIKPQNIVMTNGVCKLCDYGWATICDQRRKTYCGTFDYAAPQILEGVQYDLAVDLWCLGVLAYQLMVGKAPFYHLSRKETMKKIINVDTTSINFPTGFSKTAASFITQLLRKNPDQRMKSSEILSHPFLKSVPDQDKFN